MTAAETPAGNLHAGGWARARRSPVIVIGALFALLIIIAVAAATIGAAGIPFHRLMAAAGLRAADPDLIARGRLGLVSVLVPRHLLARKGGAAAAGGRAVMQGPV